MPYPLQPPSMPTGGQPQNNMYQPYPPQPGTGYPPQPGSGYPPTQQGYPPPQQGYPPNQSYPPQPMGYPVRPPSGQDVPYVPTIGGQPAGGVPYPPGPASYNPPGGQPAPAGYPPSQPVPSRPAPSVPYQPTAPSAPAAPYPGTGHSEQSSYYYSEDHVVTGEVEYQEVPGMGRKLIRKGFDKAFKSGQHNMMMVDLDSESHLLTT